MFQKAPQLNLSGKAGGSLARYYEEFYEFWLGGNRIKTETAATSLDDSGKTEHPYGQENPAQRYRFRYCQSARAQYVRVLHRAEEDLSRRNKGLQCGTQQVVYQNLTTSEIRLAGNYCEARTCPACYHSRQRQQAIQLDEWIRLYTRNDARFVTLTMASSDEPLAMQLTELQQSFKRLRRHVLWKKGVKYGKGIIEITYNQDRRQWHPHLHIIAVGSYIPQGKLSNAWATASGGSPVCDIRKIKQGDKIANYLSKYLGKPPSIDSIDDSEALGMEYYLALRNRRMLISFAGAPALPPLPKSEDPPEEGDQWTAVGNLNDLLKDRETGSLEAETLLSLLSDRINGNDPPPD